MLTHRQTDRQIERQTCDIERGKCTDMYTELACYYVIHVIKRIALRSANSSLARIIQDLDPLVSQLVGDSNIWRDMKLGLNYIHTITDWANGGSMKLPGGLYNSDIIHIIMSRFYGVIFGHRLGQADLYGFCKPCLLSPKRTG